MPGMPDGAGVGEGTLLKQEARKNDVIALRDARIVVMPRSTVECVRVMTGSSPAAGRAA